MAIAAPPMVASPGAGLWALAFRPFFLAAAIWAALALTLWIVLFTTGGALLSRFDPLSWHIPPCCSASCRRPSPASC